MSEKDNLSQYDDLIDDILEEAGVEKEEPAENRE